jgi:hypothetical protein
MTSLTAFRSSRYTPCTAAPLPASVASKACLSCLYAHEGGALSRKTRQYIALFVACVVLTAIVVCQVHTTRPDHEHATPPQSHANSAAHAFLDFSCTGMAAVLPTVIIFASLLFYVLHPPLLGLHPTVLVLPPFIPPRHTTP